MSDTQTAKRRPAPRRLIVLAKRMITPNMLRLTLGGPDLANFPAGQEGGYVKLNVPVAGRERPVVRTYTIRHQRMKPDGGEIDVDFALHGENEAGAATGWALRTEPGEAILVGGPGAAKPLPEGRAFYLVAGDMTALPAIAVNLANLATDARGLVLLEVTSEEDRQDLASPPGVAIRWLVNPHPGSRPDLLAGALREADWPDAQVQAWAASEFAAMRELRAILRDERGLDPAQLYISSYWKQGIDEEAHKLVKRDDALADQAA